MHISKEHLSYILGLFQADAHHSSSDRNRGRIQIELAYRDKDILEKLQKIIPVKSTIGERTRDTNFAKDSHSAKLSIYDLEFRKEMESLGLSTGSKSATISEPTFDYSRPDYLRGLLDGDGSLGLTGQGKPFVSFVTKSEDSAKYFIKEIKDVCGVERTAKPNKRDSAMNIMVLNLSAQRLASYAYYDGCLGLDRKIASAGQLAAWNAPHSRFGHTAKRWDSEQDNYILTHSIEESMVALDRTKRSIDLRLWRLKGK